MSYFFKTGNRFTVSSNDSAVVKRELPTGTYRVGFERDFGTYYLETIDGFTIPERIYGNTIKYAERIINTFLDRSGSTGVLLSGEKGSGKTLLSKYVSSECVNKGIPTIVINQPWYGDAFNKFIQNIDQPCVVIFDEFEKTYNKEEQEKLLTLFDGVYMNKNLFIVTCNDIWRIDENLKNRPGRMYYNIDFDGIDEDFVKEYCEDTLKYTEFSDEILRITTAFQRFNFDMLKALVEEVNRYGESPSKAMEMVNIDIKTRGYVRYDITLYDKDGERIGDKESWGDIDPFQEKFYLTYTNNDEYEEVTFSIKDMNDFDHHTNKMTFVNKDGFKAVFMKDSREKNVLRYIL